jgi:hypothetical protein
MARANFAEGEIVSAVRKTNGRYHDYMPLVKFKVNNETYEVIGDFNAGYVGDKVSVVYLNSEPDKAYIFSFLQFLGPDFIWSLIPIIVFIAFAKAYLKQEDVLVVSVASNRLKLEFCRN